VRSFCRKQDCRHIAAVVGDRDPIILHNLYVPAGGDEPDRAINEKFGHKLDFIAELEHWFGNGSVPQKHHGIVVGDLNIAPLENDVWSHKQLLKIVSHTPAETEGLTRAQMAGGWVDLIRQHVPPEKKVYTWWSYRAHDWALSDRGRRLDHIWTTPDLARRSRGIEILREARGWPQPSDHVPVMATLEL
jgi:exodeoxyribonuclease-3